jgi:hypothetical protein
VHEHGRKNRNQVMPGDDVGRHRRPLDHEAVTVHQLQYKNERIRKNDENGDRRHVHRAPGRIA